LPISDVGTRKVLKKIDLNIIVLIMVGITHLQDIVKELEKPDWTYGKNKGYFTFTPDIRNHCRSLMLGNSLTRNCETKSLIFDVLWDVGQSEWPDTISPTISG